jgi:hypothetical protein
MSNAQDFHTRCTVNQRVCDAVIDGGRGDNVVSKEMVSKLFEN